MSNGMPRAYLRVDPNIDQSHPDLALMIRLMCAAARQPDRGRFRDVAQLNALFGKRRVSDMMTRRDITTLEDGRVYVVGWDEWQEGDWTVSERMRRMRQRRAEGRTAPVSDVTVAASHDRNDVTTVAVAVAKTTKVDTSIRGDGDSDSLDTYHELTGWRPWSAFSGDSLRGAIRDYTDPVVDAALRDEAARDATRDTLLKRTLARLDRDAERRRLEAKEKPRAIRPKADPAEVARIERELRGGAA